MVDVVLLGKLGVGLLSILGSLAAVRWRGTFECDPVIFTRTSIALLLASRLAVCILLYVIVGLDVQSDVPAYYVPQGHAAIDGLVPYRDFESSYGPLFPFVVAAVLLVWDSATAIVLLAILVEVGAYSLWLSIARMCLTERRARIVGVVYILSPISLIMNPVSGLNQVWVMAAVGGAVVALARGRELLSGFLAAAGVLAVKALAGLFVPALFLLSRKKWAWATAFLAPVMVVLWILVMMGADPLSSVRGEAGRQTSGNLPYLGRALGIEVPEAWGAGWLALVAVGILAAAYVALRSQGESADVKVSVVVMVFSGLLFMVLSQKSYTNYLAMFLAPICIVVYVRGASWRKMIVFGGWMVIAAVEPSLYFRLLNATDIRESIPETNVGTLVGFLAVEVVLVVGYFALLFEAGLQLRRLSTVESIS